MISRSALKAKIARSSVNLTKTFLGENIKNILNTEDIINLFLFEDEEILLIFNDDREGWILTGKRLIQPKKLNQILINDMEKVDFDDIKEEKSSKKDNTTLFLHLKNNKKYKIKVEDKTWFLFYDIFKWVINKEKKDPTNPSSTKSPDLAG